MNKPNKQDTAPNKNYNNSDKKLKSKEEHSWKDIILKTPFLFIVSWIIAFVSVVAVALIFFSLQQGSFSAKNEYQVFRDYISAKSAFENRTGVDKKWFQKGIQLPDTLCFIDTNKDSKGNKKFICIVSDKKNEFLFTDIPNKWDVKQILDKDTAKFDEFVKRFFSITEDDGVDSIAKKIGAKSTYIEKIKAHYSKTIKEQRDVVFSLIYNTIAGDPQGHIAVTIESKKLKIITSKDLQGDRIDTNLFVKSMNWVTSIDTLSNKDKYILASSERLLSSQYDEASNATENKFKGYFKNEKTVQLNRRLPVKFLYYDVRKDVLHIGVNEYDLKNKITKKYLSRLKSSPEKIFYLLANDTTLYDFSNFGKTKDNTLWGKIDTDKLAKGKFTTVDFINDYSIIKTWDKAYLLYSAVFILLGQILWFIFMCGVKRKKQTNYEPEETDENIFSKKQKTFILGLFEKQKKELEEKFQVKVSENTNEKTNSELQKNTDKPEAEETDKNIFNKEQKTYILSLFEKQKKEFEEKFQVKVSENTNEKTNSELQKNADKPEAEETDKNILNKEQKTYISSLLEEQKKDFKEKLQQKGLEITSLNEEKANLTEKNTELISANKTLNDEINNALVDFQGLSADGKDLVRAILEAYDKKFKGNSLKEFENFLKEEKEKNIKQFKEKVKFDKIKEQSDFLTETEKFKKEKELLKWLETHRKSVKTLPQIPSLKKIYKDLEKEDNNKQRSRDEIIISLLSQVDQYAEGKELLPQFNNYKSQTEEYNQIKPTIDTTRRQITDFYDLCLKLNKKDKPDFWDRTALSIWAISKLATPLLRTWQKETWFVDKEEHVIKSLKSDLLQIYTTRYFLRDTMEGNSLDDFKNALNKDIPQKIEEYNSCISHEANAKLNNTDENLITQLTAVFEKIKKFETTQEFNDKMWDNFVQGFIQKAPNINSNEDKVWFFEQLFNITYHTVDYLDFIKNNKNIIYCYNYQFLHKNFDLSKTEHYDFVLNHIEKSTAYSNRIYKWTNELGIKQLKLLIEKYLIKP